MPSELDYLEVVTKHPVGRAVYLAINAFRLTQGKTLTFSETGKNSTSYLVKRLLEYLHYTTIAENSETPVYKEPPQARVARLLRQNPDGLTVSEIQATTGWTEAHVRNTLSKLTKDCVAQATERIGYLKKHYILTPLGRDACPLRGSDETHDRYKRLCDALQPFADEGVNLYAKWTIGDIKPLDSALARAFIERPLAALTKNVTE